MEELLTLVRTKRADELKIHVGTPPVIVMRGVQQPIEGPVITPE